MTDHGWYHASDDNDSDASEAAQQAERATRFGWAVIAGTTGALGCALLALAVVCVGAFVACVYVVVAADY